MGFPDFNRDRFIDTGERALGLGMAHMFLDNARQADEEEKSRNGGFENDYDYDGDGDSASGNEDYDDFSGSGGHLAYERLRLRKPGIDHSKIPRDKKLDIIDTGRKVRHLQETCLDCAFWHGESPYMEREFGCDVCFLVQVENDRSIEHEAPASDHLTCERFVPNHGTPTLCFDCAHWDQSQLWAKRKKGCRKWEEVQSDQEKLSWELFLVFWTQVDFPHISAKSPRDDRHICFDFEPCADLERGHGQRCAEMLAAEEARFGRGGAYAYVVGLSHENRKALWLEALAEGSPNVTLVRQPDNSYDRNAIAVCVNGKPGGFLSADKAAVLAPKIDGGCVLTVESCAITTRRTKKHPDREKLRVRLLLHLEGE